MFKFCISLPANGPLLDSTCMSMSGPSPDAFLYPGNGRSGQRAARQRPGLNGKLLITFLSVVLRAVLMPQRPFLADSGRTGPSVLTSAKGRRRPKDACLTLLTLWPGWGRGVAGLQWNPHPERLELSRKELRRSASAAEAKYVSPAPVGTQGYVCNRLHMSQC